jgi:hypothetical protein
MIGKAPRCAADVTPVRTPESIRRTMTIDTTWPGADPGAAHVVGRARDLLTPSDGSAPIVRAEDGFVATIGGDRTIRAIETDPPRAAAFRLVGERGGGHLRKVIGEVMPEELQGATPLYLLLDDISGASLVAGWAWSQWRDDWFSARNPQMNEADLAAMMASRAGVCVGFAPGGTALTHAPGAGSAEGTPVPDLRNPADPHGWHAFADQAGAVGMRRARRIDVTREKGAIRIDSHFQDSASHAAGGRRGLHEYRLSATADPATMRLTGIFADPRILPFPECPSATINLQQLVGARMADLRQLVLEKLRGTEGCTHLNDVVRALAEVPALVACLEERLGARV